MTEKIWVDPVAISVNEAAQLLGVSKPTVYQLIRRADFPAFKVGARTLVSLEGLRCWVDKQTQLDGEMEQ